jgi:DNA-dependent RNA polymerase auxiliary subunit epsilon
MKIHQILINDTNKLLNKLPEYHNICYKQIKKLYPNEEYHLYCGEELEEIIQNNFHKDIFTSYKKLKPYACKADLARYCLLYLYGGLYIDLNIKFINTIPDLDKLKFFAFRDIIKASKRSWSVANSIMFAQKNSKIMKKCIDIVVENCKKEYYGISVLDISGCIVLGKAIMDSNEDIDFISTAGELSWIKPKIEKNYEYNIGYLMDIDDKIIAYRKPTNKNMDNCGDINCFGFDGTNNYIEMWKNKDVYDTSIKFTKKTNLKYQ